MKKYLQDMLVIGFALFSMFFGAGNVIFPPYLGLSSGPEWLAGFASYFLADIGLALLAMFAILRRGSPEGITARLGRIPSTALMCVIVLCIGPMLAIPRTAATTYETSLSPLVAGFSPVLFSALFFLLILLLCVRETAVVDIVGKILTPALLIGLLVLIAVGVLDPIGPVGKVPLVENVAATGIEAGYQTMDVLAAIVFGYVILKSAREKGHTVHIIPVCQKRIAGCMACEYCHQKGSGHGRRCVQRDDMQEIYPLLDEAEMIVLASPIYYHNFTGQLQCAVSRIYALDRPKKLKRAALLLSSGSDHVYSGAIFEYQNSFLNYLHLEDMGIYSAYDKENKSPEKLEELRQLGRSL